MTTSKSESSVADADCTRPQSASYRDWIRVQHLLSVLSNVSGSQGILETIQIVSYGTKWSQPARPLREARLFRGSRSPASIKKL